MEILGFSRPNVMHAPVQIFSKGIVLRTLSGQRFRSFFLSEIFIRLQGKLNNAELTLRLVIDLSSLLERHRFVYMNISKLALKDCSITQERFGK
jgi:hypothetical protein